MISSLLSRLHLTPDSSSSISPPLSSSRTEDTSKDSPTSPIAKELDAQMQSLFENDYGEAEIPSPEQIVEELEDHGGVEEVQKERGDITAIGDTREALPAGEEEQEGGKRKGEIEDGFVEDKSKEDKGEEGGEKLTKDEEGYKKVEQEVVAEFA